MTLKREIKDAYIEDGASIYVKTHSNAVYVDENETETLTQRLDNVKSSITKHTTQLNEKMNNWLKGKIINFMGDSITYNTSKNTNWYPKIVGEILKCTTNNYGISGSLISGTNGMCERVLNMDKNAIINCVLGGTNDYNKAIPIGKITDTTNGTFYGALNIMCKNLITNYPNAINVLMTPLKRSTSATVNGGSKLIDYVRAIQSIAKKYNFLLINLYDNAPNYNPSVTELYKWSFDGLHPTDDYFTTFLGRKIANTLLSLESDNSVTETYSGEITSQTFTITKQDVKTDISGLARLSLQIPITTSNTGDVAIGRCNVQPSLVTALTAFYNNNMDVPVTLPCWITPYGAIHVYINVGINANLFISGGFITQ